MSGIRTNAAAELLGVSPNTLRSWERRFGYPKPRRTQGGHRQYDLAELEALRRALLETHNISSAIELARQRGEGPSSPSRLLDAFDHFDEPLADRVDGGEPRRPLGRAHGRGGAAAGARAGRRARRPRGRARARLRWATGWLHAVAPRGRRRPAARRACSCSTRARGSTSSRSTCRRSSSACAAPASARCCWPSTSRRSASCAPSARSTPTAFVFCGGEATLEVVGRLVYTVRQVGSAAPVFEYREAMPVTGDHGIPSLGSLPVEAVERLKGYVDSGRIEQVVVVPEPSRGAARRASSSRRAARPEPGRELPADLGEQMRFSSSSSAPNAAGPAPSGPGRGARRARGPRARGPPRTMRRSSARAAATRARAPRACR